MMLNTMVAAGHTSTDWREFAACRSAEPELFFPVSAAGQSLDQAERAKAVCAVCTVRRECLQFALATRQDYGVWGGMSEQERGHDHGAKLA
jgi:WhiB family redox-sensing transcriptional regulator